MHKLTYLFILFCLIAETLPAQDRAIRFEPTHSLKKAVEKAKEEKKLIFIDCYTDWCAPCKKLSTTVFTVNSAADFYNTHFVNLKLNMEKDEDGLAHVKNWGINSYPTMLFLNPETGRLVHKMIGFRDANELIKGGEIALDPNKRMDAKVARWNNGERSPEFVQDFIMSLTDMDMRKEAEEVVQSYLAALTLEQMLIPANWMMIVHFEKDPLSQTLKAVRDNKELFYAIPLQSQRELVDRKLAEAMINTAIEFARNPNLAAYDQARYEAFVDYLDQYDGFGKDMASVWMNTSIIARQEKWEELLEVIRVVESEHLLLKEVLPQYIMFFMQEIGKSGKKHVIKSSIEWLDSLMETASGQDANSYYTRMFLSNVKGLVYFSSGNHIQAAKMKKEMEKYKNLLDSMGQAGQIP